MDVEEAGVVLVLALPVIVVEPDGLIPAAAVAGTSVVKEAVKAVAFSQDTDTYSTKPSFSSCRKLSIPQTSYPSSNRPDLSPQNP